MVIQLNAKRFDIIFDQYFSPSIKDYERSLRHESTQLGFNITGPDQVRPSDFAKELKNIRFKQALVDFFILHWSTEEMVPFMNNKIILVNFKKCHSFTVTNNIHWCAKIKVEVEKLAYQLNEEAERTERPIRRLSKVMYGSTCADMQVDVMGECLSSIKHVVGVRSVFLAKRLHAV
ncbi:uncharacterized protein TNCV_543781 [Trichonephila clavipes]|nr:uncharacterized protein TNCV_543781 [Trichonephila clavipes]